MMILYFFSYTLEICNLKIELQINVFFLSGDADATNQSKHQEKKPIIYI